MPEDTLSKNNLKTAQAILSLGLTIASSLTEHNIAIVFMNLEGDVELCPPLEFLLDATSLDDALSSLVEKGYTDEQLMAYIKGRKLRELILAQDM